MIVAVNHLQKVHRRIPRMRKNIHTVRERENENENQLSE